MIDGQKELIHFTATWCGPCQSMAPDIVRFTEAHPEIKYTKIDLDNDKNAFEQYSEKFAIMSVPTMLAMVDGLFYKGRKGASNKEELELLFSEIVPEEF
jgi:thioredoxin 1